MQGHLFTVSELRAKADAVVASVAHLPKWDMTRYQSERGTRDLVEAIAHYTASFAPTRLTGAQCEESVPAHRSTGSMRRDHELGYDETRQCRRPAAWRFFGWLSAAPHDEYLCARHARVHLDPVCWSLWIDGAVKIATARAKCRRGHTWESATYGAPVSVRDFFGFGDRVAVRSTRCNVCGEPKGYEEVPTEAVAVA